MRLILIPLLFGFILPGTTRAQNTDIDLLHRINSSGTPFLDQASKILSFSVTPVLCAGPLSVFICGLTRHDSLLKRRSYVIGASLVLAAGITTGLKLIVDRPRPFVVYPFIIKKGEAGSYSFPSGHTSGAFSVATSLSLAFPKWYVIAPSFLWASAVGYSRMELGVHYPSDVLAGACIGAASGWLMWEANRWLAGRKK
ncbi:MAG TPA: phosphatase PAP2 family protein [Bacteroidia bacterium]|jgi:membrane-associated phospholipid phosphatase